MNDLPRHTLARIIRQHGRGICDAPKRVEALLRDLAGAHRREINIIIGALEERVAADLLAGGTAPREVLLARLAARLRDNLAYTPEAARWGVETWAFALGIISEAELRERALSESAEHGRSGAPSLAQDAEPTAAGRVAPPASQPPPATAAAAVPRPQPSPAPKASPPPTVNTPPQPPARQPHTTRPHAPAAPPAARPRIAPPPPARDASRRGLTLRGCFLGVVLLIVITVAAFFVVPAVIMVLKEEQAQPSINDPRIR
jgi:hypothetical protein